MSIEITAESCSLVTSLCCTRMFFLLKASIKKYAVSESKLEESMRSVSIPRTVGFRPFPLNSLHTFKNKQ